MSDLPILSTAMSGLRKKTSNKESPCAEDVDVESPQDKGSPSTKSLSASSGHNPIFLAKVILRKVITNLTSDEENGTNDEAFGIIAVLRDIIVGIILGVVTISVMIFLDHRNVIHLQSAHNFRDAAFSLLNDPETLASIEESAGLKFIKIDQYESMRNEIDKMLAENDKKLKEREEAEAKQKELVEKHEKEVVPLLKEYAKLISHPLIGLDKFCGTCVWAGKVTCGEREVFMKDTHKMGTIAAKLNVMETPSCKKQ